MSSMFWLECPNTTGNIIVEPSGSKYRACNRVGIHLPVVVN